MCELTDPEFTAQLEHKQSDIFSMTGYVAYVRNDDKSYYLACPQESCKRKVVEEATGWRCESCNRTYASCVPTYMLSARISDSSDSQFFNFYRNEGTVLMGMPAEKLRDLKEQGDIQVINEAYNDRIYRQFTFLVKVRMRPGYGGQEQKVDYVCCKVMPHSYKNENEMLLKRLKIY